MLINPFFFNLKQDMNIVSIFISISGNLAKIKQKKVTRVMNGPQVAN